MPPAKVRAFFLSFSLLCIGVPLTFYIGDMHSCKLRDGLVCTSFSTSLWFTSFSHSGDGAHSNKGVWGEILRFSFLHSCISPKSLHCIHIF